MTWFPSWCRSRRHDVKHVSTHWTCNREFYDCCHRFRWQARLCQWWRGRTRRRQRAILAGLGKLPIGRDYFLRSGDRNQWPQ